jgi:hypothetical protein
MHGHSIFGVVVAAVAVIAGAVMQYATLRVTRRNTVSGSCVGLIAALFGFQLFVLEAANVVHNIIV